MKSTIKKVMGKVHLWLGLVSGVIVFIIAITGCLYTFQAEIKNFTESYRFIAPQNKSFLLPSVILEKAKSVLPGKHPHAIMYEGNDHAAQAIFYSMEEEYYYTVFINPYSGQIQKVKDMYTGFFHYVLEGHFYLWLPHDIGQPVVASATLVFIVMLFSGLYLWWKRKKVTGSQKFTIKLDARWRRKNYDIHNVFGFYVTWIAIIFAVTGLVWGFEWFARGYYATISGGKEVVPYYDPQSDTTVIYNSKIPAIDKVYLKMVKEYPGAEIIEVHVPDTRSASIAANANPDASTIWKTDYRYFDQNSLKELSVDHMWNRIGEASGAEKLMRMNYDIHIGAILGLPGKILAFFASLIIASLPVTGFIIWYGRKYKKTKTVKKLKMVATT